MSKTIVIGMVCLLVASLLSGCTQPSEPVGNSDPVSDAATTTAASTTTTTAAKTAAPLTIAAKTVSAKEGQTVTLPITVSKGSQLVNADLYLHYDPDSLRVVEQYDATADAYTTAKAELWSGALYAAETQPGTLRVMLADGKDGLTQGGNLFSVVFEVIALPEDGANVTLEVPICGVCPDGVTDVDAVKEKLLTVKSGGVNGETE